MYILFKTNTVSQNADHGTLVIARRQMLTDFQNHFTATLQKIYNKVIKQRQLLSNQKISHNFEY